MARAKGRGRSSGRRTARAQVGPSRSARARRPGRSRSASSRRAVTSRARRQVKRIAQRRGAHSARRSTRAGAAQRRQARPIASSRQRVRSTTDHDEIRRWAEERGAQPTCVRGTGGAGDVGMIRLDFPGYSGAQSLEPVSWDDWFRKFDESNLALIYEETTARGEKSNFNKLIGRETAEKRARGQYRASRRRSQRGRTRTTGRRSANRQPSKVAKASRRAEPARRTRASNVTKMKRQRAASRRQRRKAA